MMRLWLQSYARTTPMSEGIVVSIVAHAVLIVGATVVTGRPAVPEGSLANRSYYIPPPDRVRGQPGARETITYVPLAPHGDGSGFGVPTKATSDFLEPLPPGLGNLGLDSITIPGAKPLLSPDSTFSVLDVDMAVVRDPTSAAPSYPLSLLMAGIQGSVSTRYVVDTTGRADPKSIEILRASHEEFAASVRAALPYMRFVPALLGGRRVRQLVEQEFTFKIQKPLTNPDSTKKPIP